MSKRVCIAEGELVQMADGTLRPIEQVEVGEEVLSLDRVGNSVPRKVVGVHDNGLSECVSLQTKHGASTLLTPDHVVYRGYVKKNKVKAHLADKVAQPRSSSFWPADTIDLDDAWYVWSALVVAEGSYNFRKVTCGSIELMERASALLPPDARVRRKNFNNGHVPDWFLKWPEFWQNMPDGLAHEKSIPDWVFTSSKEKVILFFRWLYMGDGWANHKTVGYATTSRKLAHQIVVLLVRLGVRASVNIRKSARLTWRDQYWVMISKSDEVKSFLETIGIEGKEQACALVMAEAERRLESKAKRGCHFSKIPGVTDPKWKRRNGLTRTIASKVRTIEAVGEHRVYDLSVEGEHRFLTAGALVSNCWLDEEPPRAVQNGHDHP